MDGKDFVNVLDMKKGLAYNCEVENKYLNDEIIKCLYKRDGLDIEFGRIVKRLGDLGKDSCLNGFRNIYHERVVNDVVRLKEIVDRIGYYDMHIADYRRHIDRNNRLLKNKKN